MTIETKPTSGNGAIFSDRDDAPNRIEILWKEYKKIDARISNRDTSDDQYKLELAMTEVLQFNKKYDIALTFDGSKCKFYLDGNQFLEVECSSGFKSMSPDPLLCRSVAPGYSSTWGTGWNGLIENVRFDGIQKRGILMSCTCTKL